jgi:hypothetical protein
MATLEERIQNLTQDINPMGSGVMSDMERDAKTTISKSWTWLEN